MSAIKPHVKPSSNRPVALACDRSGCSSPYCKAAPAWCWSRMTDTASSSKPTRVVDFSSLPACTGTTTDSGGAGAVGEDGAVAACHASKPPTRTTRKRTRTGRPMIRSPESKMMTCWLARRWLVLASAVSYLLVLSVSPQHASALLAPRQHRYPVLPHLTAHRSRWGRPPPIGLPSRKSPDGGEDPTTKDDDPTAADEAPKSLGGRVPEHVGFICDGNSRWAQRRHLPALAGHAAGADRLVEILQCLRRNYKEVRVCTFYAFSTENWNRPSKEVRDIFRVMEATIRQFGPVLLREGVEFRALGDYYDDRIPPSLQMLIDDLQVRTKEGAARRLASQHPQQDRHLPPVLCVAINYGGRSDIVQAAQRLAQRVSMGEIKVSDITESMLSSELATCGLPNPDMIIRTSGECRLSNFFLWDAAYAELRFCDEMWPDFDSESLQRALQWYAARNRRFGSRSPSTATAVTGGGRSCSEATLTDSPSAPADVGRVLTGTAAAGRPPRRRHDSPRSTTARD